MSEEKSTLNGESAARSFERDVRARSSAEGYADESDAELNTSPFFMDMDDWLADDPSNYCLPAESRFPDS